jgi:hypothetical protein
LTVGFAHSFAKRVFSRSSSGERDSERRQGPGPPRPLGRVRPGFIADLLVIDGNPLENLRVMSPYGTDLMSYNGQIVSNYSKGFRDAEVAARHAHADHRVRFHRSRARDANLGR